jgi:hypothetical protein
VTYDIANLTAGQALRRRGLSDGDPRHGSRTGYGQYGCRCEACRAANTASCRDWRRRMARGLSDGDPRHGTSNGYSNYGCRCEDCRAAYRRDRRTTENRRWQAWQAS